MTHLPDGSDESVKPSAAATELQQLEAALQAKLISPELFAVLTAQLRPPHDAPPAPPVAQPPAEETSPTPEAYELPSLLSLFESQSTASSVSSVSPASPAAQSTTPSVPAPLTPSQVVLPPLAASTAPRPAARPQSRSVARPAQVAPQPVVLPPSATQRSVAPSVAPPLVHGETTEMAHAAQQGQQRSTPTTLLALLGGVGLLGVGFYLYVDRSHPSENLTNPPQASTEEIAPVRPTQSVAAAVPKTVRVVAPDAPAPDSSTLAASSEVAPEAAPSATPDVEDPTEIVAPEDSPAASVGAVAPVPAAPEPDDDDATQKIRTVLANYYADLFAPPLAAENYFAPQVERLYIQQNLTPTQINATITQTFFPDNKQVVYQVEPGTLRVSAPAQDGSRTATYSEAVRLFRVSKGRYQRLRTQVRAKFDADYRITFLRQEKMLDNVFE